MLSPKLHIDFEPFLPFTFASEVEVESSFRLLTDRATLLFPKKINIKNTDFRTVCKLGQSLNLTLGYEGLGFQKEFEGYLSGIYPGIPFKLNFEDKMWLLKKGNFQASYKKVSLKQLISDVLESQGLNIEIASKSDIEFGKMRFLEITPAKLLQELKENYGIYSYFRDGKLNIGVPYTGSFLQENIGQTPVFNFQKNVLDNNLLFTSQEDKRVKVKAISIMPSNERIEVEIGDEDGEVHTKHYFGIEDKSKLRQLAEADLERFKAGGYKGSFTSFGFPFVRFGDAVDIEDSEYPERNGRYFVESVWVKMSSSGFRRKITIGNKLA